MVVGQGLRVAFGGQRESESRSLPHYRLDRDIAAVVTNRFATDRQADTGSTVFRAGMQALEQLEDPVDTIGRNTDAIVLHRQYPPCTLPFRTDGNLCFDFRPTELDRIPDQVLEYLPDEHGITVQSGQDGATDLNLAFLECGSEIEQHPIQDLRT